MTPTSCSSSANAGPLQRAYAFARWLAVTISFAWFAPYGFLAIGAAIGGLLGIGAVDVRREVVGLATLDTGSWSSAGPLWAGYAWFCGLATALYRTLTARPVQVQLGVWVALLEIAAHAALRPITTWLDRRSRFGRAVPLIGLILVAASLALLNGSQRPTGPAGHLAKPTPLPIATTSAALSLPDKAIRSGTAAIEQRDANTYVVMFKEDTK
jgi:hypothetical protein